MITIANVCNLYQFDNATTTKYAIVRSMRKSISGTKQLAVLSPSEELFHWYWGLARKGRWTDDLFRNEYIPRFLREMHSKDAVAALNDIWLRSKKGEHIVLACYCLREQMCHRSIVAGLLSGAGADVRTETGLDYSGYYTDWRELYGC